MPSIIYEPLDRIYAIYKLPPKLRVRVTARLARTESAVRSCLALPVADRVVELSHLVRLNLASAEAGQVLMLRLNLRDAAALSDLFHADAEALEHASMSLAVEDTKTALDLCVAAAQAAFVPNPPRRHEQLADLQQFPKVLPANLVAWHQAVTSHPIYRQVLGPWRRAMVHRDFRYVWRDVPPDFAGPEDWTFRRRRVAEVGLGPNSVGTYKIMLPDDVFGIVAFGCEEVELFCEALEASLP